MSSPAPHHGRTRVGIAGCGAVTAEYHAPALELLEGEGLVEVTGLFDPDRTARAAIARTFPGAQVASELDALLERKPDLVIVASPPRFHAEQTIRALEAGCSVLCEKPLATTAADAEAMVAAADAAGLLLAVGMVRRYLPATRTIRDLLARGALGELREVRCFEGGPFDWPVRSESYFDRSESGGGVFLDIGAHAIDLLTWWLGPPTAVDYADDAMGGVEANCRLRLSYPGFDVDVHLSRDWARPNEYGLFGSRGWLRWTVNEADAFRVGLNGDELASEIRLHEARVENGLPATGPPAANYHQSFTDQVRSVVRAIRGEEAPVVHGAEALESMRLIERCYRERSLLSMPWLSERESRAARRLGGSAA